MNTRTHLTDLLWITQGEQWMADSACAEVDPALWFPEKGESTREAKQICRRCAVQGECLEYALANDERYGIWGGLSDKQRRKLRNRRTAEQGRTSVRAITPEHIATVRQLVAAGFSDDQIGHRIRRSARTVKYIRLRVGLTRVPQRTDSTRRAA